MTEKQQQAIDIIFSKIPDEYKESYREIAECAISLGYIPSIKGSKQQFAIFNKAFSKAKTNRTILKFETDPKQKNPPGMLIRYFANEFPYSPLFTKAIENRINAGWGSPCQKITGVGDWVCGDCGSTHAYRYAKPDGEIVVSCGYMSLVFLPYVKAENVAEIKDALVKQADFYAEYFNK